MTLLFQTLLIVHIVAGAASLVLFWIPVTARKGGKTHVSVGLWYARCMYVVAGSALLLCLLVVNDPIGIKHANQSLTAEQAFEIATQRRGVALFLFSIGVLVIANVRHGLLTLDEDLKRVRTRSANHTVLNVGLALLAVVLAAVGYRESTILFYVFAALCAVTAGTNLRYAWRTTVDRSARIRSHLSAMIGAGIASHTAFFVFGANRFLSELLVGNWQLVPWITPGVVGGVIINVVSRRYVRKTTSIRNSSNA